MIEDREEIMGSLFHATIQFNVALPETVCSIIQEDFECLVLLHSILYTMREKIWQCEGNMPCLISRVFLSVCMFVYLYVCMFVCVPVCSSVRLCVSLYV